MSESSSSTADSNRRIRHVVAEALAIFLRHEVRADREAARKSYYSQHNSPLGRTRHLELARLGILPSEKSGSRVLIRRDVVEFYHSDPSFAGQRRQ
jgi:hypothetical protein